MFAASDLKECGTMEIVTAPWIVPVGDPVIRNGSIVIAEERIFDIGAQERIVDEYPHLPQTLYSGVLMPGLVNCHMHLELSYMQSSELSEASHSFVDWIASLVAKRNRATVSRAEKVLLAVAMAHEQHRSGVAVVFDTGNEFFEELQKNCSSDDPRVIRALEFIGPNKNAVHSALATIASLDKSVSATAHSPYSTGAELLVEIKKRCSRLGHIFSMHAAESRDEIEFICRGGGQFRDFLQQRNSWDGMFTFEKGNAGGTVEYLHSLGLLDAQTLLVHCVHVSDKEILLIQSSGAKICLCPGSNRALGVGTPPVKRMVDAGLLPGIGTDSLASNPHLDMWREMGMLAKDHPDVPLRKIVEMATLGGAMALGLESDYGDIGVGKKARFIHVSSPPLLSCSDEDMLFEELVAGGQPSNVTWVAPGLSL